jgi:hypothetical protein
MTLLPEELKPLYEFLQPYLAQFWHLFKLWWWVFFPFFLWKRFLFFYLWWRTEVWDSTIKKIFIEIKIPQDVVKPIKAMEYVFAGLHAMHDVPTWREKWIEGQFQLKFSLEIASIEGDIHFFIRIPEIYRNLLESNIYAQYPEAEIVQVPDYTLGVPDDIPNKEWDVWGMDLVNTKPNPYPIKTYKYFETESEEKEERKVDPLATLLEGLSTLKKGEQMWIQITAKPIRTEGKNWIKEGLEIRDSLLKRHKPEKPKPILMEVLDILIFGVKKSESKPEPLLPQEMRLTPGEREEIEAIESKISKFGFECNIRYIYVGKKEVFFKPKVRIPFSFFKALSTENLGGFRPFKYTITKVKSPVLWFLDKRRLYLRQRKIFKKYKRRLTPLFPQPGGTFILNTEELATIFHFPGKLMVPASLERVDLKKGEPPIGLPIE